MHCLCLALAGYTLAVAGVAYYNFLKHRQAQAKARNNRHRVPEYRALPSTRSSATERDPQQYGNSLRVNCASMAPRARISVRPDGFGLGLCDASHRVALQSTGADPNEITLASVSIALFSSLCVRPRALRSGRSTVH